MEQLLVIATVLAVLITAGTVVGSAVWVVASIKAESKLNRAAIKPLSDNIKKLTVALEHLDDKHDNTVERLTRLEERVGLCPNHPNGAAP